MAVVARKSSVPSTASSFDSEWDIVVVGSGAGGLASALFAAWEGDRVVVLEKADALGGTTRKAAFWYWVPNNKHMQAVGIEDRREDCIRYMARLSHPEAYDANDPHFGMTDWEYDSFAAIYDSASPAVELLADRGALEYRHCDFVPDYWAELPEDKAPKGRVLLPKDARATMSDGGEVAIRTMSDAARKAGVEIRTGVRVQRVVTNAKGEVVGVEADGADGKTTALKAGKAVIFATGGFTHDKELRRNFGMVPVFGGCAAVTNEGDFVHIGTSVGAELKNMNGAWMCPIVLEKALNNDPTLIGTFSPSGDSMIYVDRNGKRVTNEKLAYNESAQAFFEWDATQSNYPNLVLVAVWDSRAQQHCSSDEYGRFIVEEGENDAHVIRGQTLEELAANVKARVAGLSSKIGGMRIADDFAKTLSETIARFNGFARNGKDLDFRRGERIVENLFNGPVAESPSAPNPTMYPISDEGPYYAALMTGGNLDTKGGPVTNTDGQVLTHMGKPVPGLYGVGNCVASASGRAYWAGGATLGPILAFAYRAANSAHKQPAK